MQIPDFQRKQMEKTVDVKSFILIYDTGVDDKVEILGTKIRKIHYPLSFETEFEASNFVSWFKKECFLNLRPIEASRLFKKRKPNK